MEIAGVTIPAGAQVIICLAASKRDADCAVDSETLDLERGNSHHIAFGHGIHFCLGAPLARLEGKIAVDVLLTRLADIQITRPSALQFYDNVFGPWSLPLTVRWA